MYIRKFTTPAGKKRFKCVVKYQGRQYATKTFDTHGAARKWGRIKEDEIEQLRATRRLPVERITVAELSEKYLVHRQEVGQRCPYRPAQIEWWVERIGRLYIGEVTPDDIAGHLDAYASTVSTKTGSRPTGATVNRMKAAAGAMFKYAIRKHRLEHNPIKNVLPQPEAKKRMRWLQDDELPRLLKAARQSRYPKMHLIILMALTTGGRRSEIGRLCWEDVNLRERWAQLHRTKNGKPRKLYLTNDVVEELLKFRQASGWIFPSPLTESRPMNWENHWRRCLREAGIDGLRFHDLRHTAASWMAEEGKTMAEIAEVLGHSNPNITTWLYTHFTEKH